MFFNIEEERAANELTIINRRAIIAGVIVLSLVMLYIIRQFIEPIIISAALASLMYPISEHFAQKLTRGNRGGAALITTLLVLSAILIPGYFLSTVAVDQVSDMMVSGSSDVQQSVANIRVNIDKTLERYPSINSVIQQVAPEYDITDTMRDLSSFIRNSFQNASANFMWLIVKAAIVFFTFFYFLRDGEIITKSLRNISPFRSTYDEMVIKRFLLVSRAVVRGTVIVALVQSSIATLTLLACGVQGWLIWGVIMFFLAMIPMAGCWVIMIPIGIGTILTGHPLQGVIILAMSLIVVSNIDNIIRPRLVGSHAKLHDLIVFFSVVGGITTFGVLGVIVGPVIAAFFVAFLEIYGMEFRKQLNEKSDNISEVNENWFTNELPADV